MKRFLALVLCNGYGLPIAARNVGEFQEAREAPVSIAIPAERATQKFAQRAAARRVELKMVRRLRCVSVTGRKRHAPSLRLGGGPVSTQRLVSHIRYTTLAGLSLCLSGCLGYTIGPVKPNYLSDVHSIAIPTFKNQTLIPRIEVLVTDSVIKQFQQDGTFKIASDDAADATLKGEISRISRAPARSLRGNVLSTTEFNLVMRVKYRLVSRDGKTLGPPGEVVGTTSFFRTADVVTNERQALPLAAEELAEHLVTQLSEGW